MLTILLLIVIVVVTLHRLPPPASKELLDKFLESEVDMHFWSQKPSTP
jgi:hypothetical protein